jgi:hypothetical protein
MNIREKEQELFEEWKKRLGSFIEDGVVKEDSYKSSDKKIILIMKEANDPGQANWDLRAFLENGGTSKTWDTVTRWIMGIRNIRHNYSWAELHEIKEEQRKTNLKTIGVINLKKNAGKGTANNPELIQAVIRDSDLIYKQYEIYQPDLVICCGSITFDLFVLRVLKMDYAEVRMSKKGISYLVEKQGRHIINFYHPEARVMHSLLYYGIIDAIKEIQDMGY